MEMTQGKKTSLLLRNSLIFGSLDAKSFLQLSANITLETLKQDEVLFKQNEAANSIFVLETGLIKLVRVSCVGTEKIIELISPGDFIAEAVVLSEKGRYPVSAVALCKSQAWCIDSTCYKKLLRCTPKACFSLMAVQSRRLQELISEIDYLTLHSATSRLVTFLIDHARDTANHRSAVDLPYAKYVLASRLSIEPETLSRTFSKLSKERLIQIEERRITLLDIPRLTQLSLSE